MEPTSSPAFNPRIEARQRASALWATLLLLATLVGIVVLVFLLVDLVIKGGGRLTGHFFTNYMSFEPDRAGIKSALVGSLWLMLLTTLIAVPVGVGAAVWLEEYASRGRLMRLVQLNIANLAGVPSVIYGILGLTFFVRFLALDRSLLAGALTMALLILPVIVIATQEALRSVPKGLRESAYALGATRWQVIRSHLLPVAAPGILTGVILAVSRAVGETAPLIVIGGFVFIAFTPGSLLDPFTALPLQIFNWTGMPQASFRELAAAAILVLMVLLLAMNGAAIVLRNRFERNRPR
ncbi:MAG: phosphate ABC transporter permease PstA [Bacteroidetes bacterium]|nr:phosphate ABC transporter permease PstA [Bacteroidota bacterium]